MNDFLQAMQARRSYYALSKASPVGDERLEALVRQAVAHTPSAFNMQSGRAVLLLGMHHDKLWQITLEALAAVTPPERFEATRQKIDAFAAGHGTVLFFDDTAVTQSFARQNPLYSASFPVWAQQAGGMLQFAVWTLLEEAGLGASLQHYNPLIDEAVKRVWQIPDSWQLLAQMPFGAPAGAPGEKAFEPLERRVKVYR